MPVTLNGSPTPNGGVVPGSTLERQLLSIEASKRARAAGEPLPPPTKAAHRPQHSLAAQAARQRSKSRSRSGSPATPAVTPRAAAAPGAAVATASGELATPAGGAAAAPPQQGGDGAAAGSPSNADAAANRAAEDEVLAQANAIRARRSQLALAYGRPWDPPPAPPDHRTYLCQEAAWLAVDFAQERLWKRFAAKSIAFAAAAERRAKTLKPVPQPVPKCGDQLGKVLGEGGLERAESAGRRSALTRTGSRVSRSSGKSGRAAAAAAAATVAAADEDGTGADSDDDLGPATPPSFGEGALLYYGAAAAAMVPGVVSHLRAQLEARIVDSRLAIRAWEEEYAAAKDERAEALKRSASDGDRLAMPSGPTATGGMDMYPVDDLGVAVGGRKSSSRRDRQKRNRVPNYALVEEDMEWDTEEAPPPRQRQPPSRRPPPMLRDEPLTGTRVSERQAGRKRRAEAADLDDFEPGGRRLHRRTAPPPRTASGRDRRISGRRGDGGQDAGWTKEEDELLAAVVHEFGENYRLVSDVMSPAAMVTGVFRNAKACAERFKKLAELSQAQRGVENAETALAVLGMNKAMARQLIATQLPTPDGLLRSRMDILFDCGQRARERRTAQQEAARNSNSGRTEPHPSQAVAVQRVLASSGGQALDPLRIAGIQMGTQAAAPMVYPAMVAGGLQPAGGFPPIGAPPGAPLAPPGTPRLQGAGSGVALPAAASPGALQPAAAPGQPPGVPPAATASGGQPPQPRPRGVSTTELQRILQTGRAPNGQPITEHQRSQIVQQLRLRQQQTQAKLQHMLNHGTPEQRQQAQQALATHAARQQAAQAAAQARSQTPNGTAAPPQQQQQQHPQPQQQAQQTPQQPGTAVAAAQQQPGQAPAVMPPQQQQQQQQQQSGQQRLQAPGPGLVQPGQPLQMQPPGQQQALPLQQPPTSLAMPHGGSLAAIRPAAPAALPASQAMPAQQMQPGQQIQPPASQPQQQPAANPQQQPSQPMSAPQTVQQQSGQVQQQPQISAAAAAALHPAQHLAANQAAQLAQQQQRQRAALQQQPGMPLQGLPLQAGASQPQQAPPQQQLPPGVLPPASAAAAGFPSASRPAMPGIPRPGAAQIPMSAAQLRPGSLAPLPLQQPLPGQQVVSGQGLAQPQATLQQMRPAMSAAPQPRPLSGGTVLQQQQQPQHGMQVRPAGLPVQQMRPPVPGQQPPRPMQQAQQQPTAEAPSQLRPAN